MLIRIVKLGGSLLSLPRLLPALDEWIKRQSPAHHALVVGGGPWVQHLRSVQHSLVLDDSAAHHLAIAAMSWTARLVSAASYCSLPAGYPVIDSADELSRAAVAILDIAAFLRHHPASLPVSWSVTSDSLAAWAAQTLGASELILLKSRPLCGPSDDLLDAYFPVASQGVPAVRLVDFRAMMYDRESDAAAISTHPAEQD